MAEGEDKRVSAATAKWPEEVVDSVLENDKAKEGDDNQATKMKSSWSGWFQRMNDALVNAVTEEDPKETVVADDTVHVETKEGEHSWGAWGSSFLKQAKEKTLTTLELVKKDLTEFSDVVQNETASIVSSTTTKFRERAPGLVDNIVGKVNSVLVEDTTRGEEDNEVPITAEDAAALYANRAQARLYAIQSDPGTFLNEPDGAPELFDDWLDHSFNLQEKKGEISELLVNNPTLRNLYTRLVPIDVSNTIFWQRYFYKLHQLELDEARRQALLKREEAAAFLAASDSLRLSWGDESEADIHAEHIDNAETESFCDLSQDVIIDAPPVEECDIPPRKQSPLCGREPPEGVNAIPKSSKGKKCDAFNVEMKDAEKNEEERNDVQPLDCDSNSSSKSGTPVRNDEGSLSPVDKKSDDWVEWEENGTIN